jgi:hypothetical protein
MSSNEFVHPIFEATKNVAQISLNSIFTTLYGFDPETKFSLCQVPAALPHRNGRLPPRAVRRARPISIDERCDALRSLSF